jgi:chromosome partitioning protein
VRAASDSGRVSLIDLDPQQSLARWHELRRGNDLADNPGLLRRGDELPIEKVRMLKEAGAEWIFLDLPPGDFDIIEPAIEAADFVIIPVKASPIDLEALDPVVEVCEYLEKPYRFLLTMYDDSWKLSQSAFPYLERKRPGHTLEQSFGYRTAYVGAMIGGATGPEFNGNRKQANEAAKEVNGIWDAIKPLALAAVRQVPKAVAGGRRS